MMCKMIIYAIAGTEFIIFKRGNIMPFLNARKLPTILRTSSMAALAALAIAPIMAATPATAQQTTQKYDNIGGNLMECAVLFAFLAASIEEDDENIAKEHYKTSTRWVLANMAMGMSEDDVDAELEKAGDALVEEIATLTDPDGDQLENFLTRRSMWCQSLEALLGDEFSSIEVE